MNDYWSKKIGPAHVRATAPGSSGSGALPPVGVYVAKDQPSGVGYLTVLCAFLAIAAFADRDGSRMSFVLSAVAVLVVGALLFWRANVAAVRRVELHADDALLLIGRKNLRRLSTADLVRVDTVSGKLSQFLGWDELRLRSSNDGVERIQQPHDPSELLWQIKAIAPAVQSDLRTTRRPWIATATVVLLLISTSLAAVGTLTSYSNEASTLQVAVAAGVDVAALLFALLLLRSSHGAWVALVLLALVGFGAVLLDKSLPAWPMGLAVAWLALLLAPGSRRWASD